MRLFSTFFITLIAVTAAGQDVGIGVFGLFHSSRLVVSATTESAVLLHANDGEFVLTATSGCAKVTIRLETDGVRASCNTRSITARRITFTSRSNGPADLELSIPGKITRRYHGKLQVSSAGRELVPVVTTDLETAVASVVAAETIAGEPIEALKAQAVAVRSYFVSGTGRHNGFDFCDTTHCQFLRSPPAAQTPAYKATLSTHGLALAFNSQTFAAMYTRSCAGRTLTPSAVGMPVGAYPYYSVECQYCRAHPSRWNTRVDNQDAAGLIPSNEHSRLQIARRLGWNAVPSNAFVIKQQGTHVVLEGVGQGHGIGLCQAGAKAMAEQGSSFREILAHYYPNTALISLPQRP